MTDQRSPLGIVILAMLESRGMSQTDLARHMGRPIKTVNEIIKGKSRCTAETALQLGDALGLRAETWLSLESQFRLDLARKNLKR